VNAIFKGAQALRGLERERDFYIGELDVEIGKSMSYLDVWITINDDKIETSFYTKPTDLHSYLHFTSYHPTHVTQNLPYGLFLCIKRICSD
jgi:hypothetical protein